MDIIEKLKNKLFARQQDADAEYWARIGKAASGELSERAQGALLDELEPLLTKLGKTVEDVVHDVELVRDFDALRDAPERLVAARSEVVAIRRDVVAKLRHADELEAEARRVREAATNDASRAGAAMHTAEQRMAGHTKLRAKFAQRGHPEHVAHSRELAKQQKVDHLQAELRGIESKYPESQWQQKRNAIEPQLARARAGVDDAPNADEADDDAIDPLPQEVAQ